MTSIQKIIADVASGKLTPEQGEAAIAALEREEKTSAEWTVVDEGPTTEPASDGYGEQAERIESWADKLAKNAMNFAENVTRSVSEGLERLSVTVDTGAQYEEGDVPGIAEGQVVRGDICGSVLGDIGAGARIDGDVLGGVQGDIGTGARIKGDVHGGIGGGMHGIIDGDLMGDVQGDLDGTVRGDVDGSVHGNLSGTVGGDLRGDKTEVGQTGTNNAHLRYRLMHGADALQHPGHTGQRIFRRLITAPHKGTVDMRVDIRIAHGEV